MRAPQHLDGVSIGCGQLKIVVVVGGCHRPFRLIRPCICALRFVLRPGQAEPRFQFREQAFQLQRHQGENCVEFGGGRFGRRVTQFVCT